MIRLIDILRILGVYKIYEKVLYKQIKNGVAPNHIGLILDGNRRWASRNKISKEEAYRIGAEKVKQVIKWSRELGIKSVTFFIFSTENIYRPPDEVETIFTLFKEYLEEALTDDELIKNGIKIKFIGDHNNAPNDLRDLMNKLEERTKECNSMIVNIAFLYGGKWDIVNATKRIIKDVLDNKLGIESITIETFQKYLSTSHLNDNQDVDLILRTGGEYRLSNFLLWQAAYSELIFLDIYWPEFRKIDLMRAIRTYQKRHRRFGR
ncbi:di-trans,poly-cis-decaprenylcistransferase [Candidatus Geothermarchaeota archaeon]|nr:MAG: di-trans,poly-cis-decaprenylcistransferase [Candidatus Geothermarchaeota archaeon]